MGGRGPAPNPPGGARRNPSMVPLRGDWKPAPGIGWQHGDVPSALFDDSETLRAESLAVWDVWMSSWVASNWKPVDVPGLRITIRLYDMLVRYVEDPMIWRQNDDGTWVGVKRPNPMPDLARQLDTYGITPKGQQDRRWVQAEDYVAPRTRSKPAAPYARLRAVKP